MKKTLTVLLITTTLLCCGQQTIIRRITTTTGTIPQSDTTQGVIKVDTAFNSNLKYIRYIGTTNLNSLFPSGAIGNYGWLWIYIPSASTNYFGKVISVAAVGDATVDTFRIQVDRAMNFTGSVGFKSIVNKLYGYSFQNDGGDTGTANGVNILNLETVGLTKQDIAGTSPTPYQEPVKIVATTTDFLIIERKGQ